eukprot:TRINITY_DN2619_c0_g1_i1.p1 TRINITY_DN2619_c0_g1~~TRINITY_DN2619_c0_g1_i1.p1  ORF type:complete len:499 (-),score=87.48 TRINITY_DN2619_c0_g1_i1:107-1564(-)
MTEVVYQISLRPWLYELSLKYGQKITLAHVPTEEWIKLQQKKITMVWLMGVWSIGQYGVYHDRVSIPHRNNFGKVLPDYDLDDIIGSPYAITEYKVNPQVGTEEDLKKTREVLKKYNLKLMLDFVPNHMAVDCPFVKSHPEYFVRLEPLVQKPFDPQVALPNGVVFGRSNPWDASWTDTAQLNYCNAKTREYMTDNLLYVCSLADGVRCDMAYLVLNSEVQRNWGKNIHGWASKPLETEFWRDAINAVQDKYPNTVFLAETYGHGEYLQELGFDYVYDKDFYDLLTWGNLDNIRGYLWNKPLSYLRKGCHFVENHDEDRAAYHFGSNERANGAAIFTMTIPGMKFYHHGQSSGFKNKLQVHLRRSLSEPVQDPTKKFYEKLFSVCGEEIFLSGDFKMCAVSGTHDCWRVIAYSYSLGKKRILVAINYSDQPGSGYIVLDDLNRAEGDVELLELMSSARYQRPARELMTSGLIVVVEPWSGQIFAY